MKVESKLQAIFDMEVSRLYKLAADAPLDMADVVRLEKLVSAHAKFRPSPIPEDDLESISTEELLNGLKDPSPKA